MGSLPGRSGSPILAVLFVASFALERLGEWPRRIHRTSPSSCSPPAAFLVVYLGGIFNIESEQAASQFAKGLARFAITSASARSGSPPGAPPAALLLGRARRALRRDRSQRRLRRRAARVRGGRPATSTRPFSGHCSATRGRINFYGSVEGADVYRPNALTNDPNHLGIVLLLPLLILTPLYLRLERGHPMRIPLMVLLPFLLLVELATLSRSGLLGLLVGVLVLLFPYGRRFVSAAVLVPSAASCWPWR